MPIATTIVAARMSLHAAMTVMAPATATGGTVERRQDAATGTRMTGLETALPRLTTSGRIAAGPRQMRAMLADVRAKGEPVKEEGASS